jgi:aminopeptidase N
LWQQIKMHQKNLEIDHQTSIKLRCLAVVGVRFLILFLHRMGDKSWQVTGTSDDNKEETVLFKFPEEVPKTDSAVLHIKWTADLKKDPIGLYRTTYIDAKGKRHTTISTHFEPTFARRCFPCFDEPKSKATWEIRVILEARFHVLSNMPPDTEDNIMPNVYPPMREWRFQKTPLISTYMLGITAGEWDRVERKSKNGAVVRTWAPLGRAADAELTNEWATRVLDFFDEYFATPYALPKLDIVPVDDFGSSVAMENWGLIIGKSRKLLLGGSTDAGTVLELKELVAHEVAHMWFGNLVTPRFWDALWLKEGFATYFGYFVCDALEPNAHWKSRFQVQETVPAKLFDSRAATHALEATISNTGEAVENFDDVTYSKGASLVQMVESYIGSDALRNGVRKYIDQFKYKNAASLDLWLALMKYECFLSFVLLLTSSFQGTKSSAFCFDWCVALTCLKGCHRRQGPCAQGHYEGLGEAGGLPRGERRARRRQAEADAEALCCVGQQRQHDQVDHAAAAVQQFGRGG